MITKVVRVGIMLAVVAVAGAILLPQISSKPPKKDRGPDVTAHVDLGKNQNGQPSYRFNPPHVWITVSRVPFVTNEEVPRAWVWAVPAKRGDTIVLTFDQSTAIPSWIWIEDHGTRVTPKMQSNVLGTISVSYTVP